MAQRLEIHKCTACGNVVEVLTAGTGDLVCCNKPMEHLAAKTADQGREKHVPVIEKLNGGVKVKIGSIPHPMEEKHYIEWIEIITDGKVYREFLKPGQAPEAVFNVAADKVSAREHCNLHGIWEVKEHD
ncbi:MAG: desulfoferrodoxin [Planctomycetes bacterium RBG_13_60_9]|nr:MAG: desulfoferrodoxin [Planctomycetes bacterium RBG_13_60_9]